MDPVTQGALGAVFAQTHGNQYKLTKAGIIGAIAAITPDLDVLIRSSSDPLFALEFHRHFSHSLLFIPIGALLCCAILYPTLGKRWGLSFKQTFLWCLIGFATHGLLDGCTTYGTQLLWPLSSHRFAWDIISIVDPLVTLPLLILSYLAAKTKKKYYAYSAIVWLACYFSFGYIQHERAIAIGAQKALDRNHQAINIEAKPSLGNLIVWKVIYETDNAYFVDAVKPGLFTHQLWEGESIAKLNISRDLNWLDLSSQQAKDIERFRWFSGGYISLDPKNPLRIVDVRYSMLPNSIEPLWGIELSKTANQAEHVMFESVHNRPQKALNKLLSMIFYSNYKN